MLPMTLIRFLATIEMWGAIFGRRRPALSNAFVGIFGLLTLTHYTLAYLACSLSFLLFCVRKGGGVVTTGAELHFGEGMQYGIYAGIVATVAGGIVLLGYAQGVVERYLAGQRVLLTLAAAMGVSLFLLFGIISMQTIGQIGYASNGNAMLSVYTALLSFIVTMLCREPITRLVSDLKDRVTPALRRAS